MSPLKERCNFKKTMISQRIEMDIEKRMVSGVKVRALNIVNDRVEAQTVDLIIMRKEINTVRKLIMKILMKRIIGSLSKKEVKVKERGDGEIMTTPLATTPLLKMSKITCDTHPRSKLSGSQRNTYLMRLLALQLPS